MFFVTFALMICLSLIVAGPIAILRLLAQMPLPWLKLMKYPTFGHLPVFAPLVCQDVEIDASGEDLPAGWVKKQRVNGSIYYLNVTDGTRQSVSPHELARTHEVAPPPRSHALNRIFQVGMIHRVR